MYEPKELEYIICRFNFELFVKEDKGVPFTTEPLDENSMNINKIIKQSISSAINHISSALQAIENDKVYEIAKLINPTMQIQCISTIASIKTKEIVKEPPTMWTSLHST